MSETKTAETNFLNTHDIPEKRPETPRIKYSNLEEWKTTQLKAYNIIREYLNGYSGYASPYEMVSTTGLGFLCYELYCTVEHSLNIITKDQAKEWASEQASSITRGLESCFNGFINTGIWDRVCKILNPTLMSNMMYNNIIHQLGGDNKIGEFITYGDVGGAVLANICVFPCKTCGKYATSLEDDKCFDCLYPKTPE